MNPTALILHGLPNRLPLAARDAWRLAYRAMRRHTRFTDAFDSLMHSNLDAIAFLGAAEHTYRRRHAPA